MIAHSKVYPTPGMRPRGLVILVLLTALPGCYHEPSRWDEKQQETRRNQPATTREAVAGARRRGLGQEVAQIIEDIGGGIDGVAIDHVGSGPSAQRCEWLSPTLAAAKVRRSETLLAARFQVDGKASNTVESVSSSSTLG